MKTPLKRPAAPQRAVLVRRQRVDIGDVSRTGCRIEGRQRLATGTIGMLTVDIDGQPHLEMFRVSRSAGPDPEHVYEAGLEFLPLPADRASLHDVAAQLDQSDDV